MTAPSRPAPIGWAFLFAMRREAAPFVSRLQPITVRPDAPCPATLYHALGQKALVVETGIGAANAGQAIAWVLDHFEPRLVVMAGFAGALSPKLAAGEVIVASGVVEPDELVWRVALPMELGHLECGRLWTSPRLVSTPAEKKAVFEETGALAVDMESGTVAEACQVRHVPCACVRVVSDTADQGLSPELVELFPKGHFSLRRVLSAVVRRPRLAAELLRFERATRHAARALADALERLLPSQ